MQPSLSKIFKKNVQPIIQDATLNALENICSESTLSALYNIKDFIHFVQGTFKKLLYVNDRYITNRIIKCQVFI